MKPDSSSQGGDSPQPQASNESNNNPAANVIRAQINALYGDAPVATPAAPSPSAPGAAPRTEPTHDHTSAAPHAHTQVHTDQWKQYHSAWQNYYQQYYAQYYAQARPTASDGQTSTDQPDDHNASHYFTHQPAPDSTAAPTHSVSQDEALYDLRRTLLGKVKESAKTIRRSRHFIPIIAGVLVVLLFVFIQYNSLFIATVNAYISPGAISPQNIVINPNGDTAVTKDPRLIIPKINVDVPVLYDVGNDHASQMAAMEKGVAHFAIPGASSHPGEIGNTVLSGHSSNDLFDGGDYKFIFAQLDKLVPGDTIYANYNGVRYTYVVTKKEVVKPTQVSALVYATDKPILTLITCTPLGTALNRLLITAEQVSPDPGAAAAAPTDSGQLGEDSSMPGSSPTLFERLFGAR